MNDFLDNLGKAVGETAKKAIKASGDVVELTKTSLNIKFDEAKRENFYREIGKLVYGAYKDSPESIAGDVIDFCRCIDEIELSINSQKAKAAGIKNKKYCVNCGVILCKIANYCYSCGAKQPEIVEEDEDEKENENEGGCCCCGEEDEDCGSAEDCGCGGEADEDAEDENCCCGEPGEK
jgi:hypothetical protein